MSEGISGRSSSGVQKPRMNTREDRMWYLGIAAVLMLFVIVPVTMAAVGFIGARLWATRRGMVFDRATVKTVAVLSWAAAVALASLGDFGWYLQWLGSLVHLGDLPQWQAPYAFMVSLAAAMTSTAFLLEDTRILKWVPKAIGRARVSKSSVMPDKGKRDQLANITLPPGHALPVPGRGNSVFDDAPAKSKAVGLGWDVKRRVFSLTWSELNTHMLVLGASGSGKSVTLMTLAAGLADQGMSGIVIDHKEDTKPGGLRDFLATYASHHALEFQELRLSDPNSATWFNPISQMGPDEMRDTILALMRFDDEYWQNLSKDLLTQLVNLLYYAHQVAPDQVPAPTLSEIGRLLKYGTNIGKATMKYRALALTLNGVDESDFVTITDMQQDSAKNAVGFGSKITQLYGTQAGRSVLIDGEGKRPLDVTAGGLIYVGLDNQGKPDLTSAISAAILKKLNVYAAQRTTGVVQDATPRFIIIDEASVVNREIVKDLLARARSAGIATILATQGPKDWIDRQGDDWNEMLNNVNVLLVMKMNDPVSAEMCAEAIGNETRVEVSQRVVEGYVVKDGTMRERVDYRVSPDQIRSLGQGEAIVRVGTPERYSFLKVALRDARA